MHVEGTDSPMSELREATDVQSNQLPSLNVALQFSKKTVDEKNKTSYKHLKVLRL